MKKPIIIIILAAVMLAAGTFVYLQMKASQPVACPPAPNDDPSPGNYQPPQTPPVISEEELTANYQSSVAPLYHDLQSIYGASTTEPLTASGTPADQLRDLRNQAISLRVPEKYKKFHVDLVFALSDLKNFASSSQERLSEFTEIQDFFDNYNAEYPWLK